MSVLPVTVEQSQNRHSRAVMKNGMIVIRLARALPRAVADAHIASLTKRMQTLAVKERHKKPIDPFSNVLLQDGMHTVSLQTGALTLHRRGGTRTSLASRGGCWRLTVAPHANRAAVERLLWNAVAREHHATVTRRVHAINDALFGYRVTAVTLRHTRSQWGSCGYSGRICINTALLFLPQHLLDYVIVHELAHLRYRSHGPRFWALVEQACPTYEDAIRQLRTYRIVSP